MLELGKWGSQFVPPTVADDTLLPVGSYALTLKTFFRPERAQEVHETYELRIDDEVLQVQITAVGFHALETFPAAVSLAAA